MSLSAVSVPLRRWSAVAELDNVAAVVTTRHGGVSQGPYSSLNLGLHVGDYPEHVVENRRRAALSFGTNLDDLVFCNQTHSNNIAVVSERDRGRGTLSTNDAINDCDALITTTVGITLVIMVADCVPLIIVDPVNGVLACVHAGWRGTAQRITAKTVEMMYELGAQAKHVVACIGPHISAEKYVVDYEVAARLQAAHPPLIHGAISPSSPSATAHEVVPDPQRDKKFHVDLGALNREQLQSHGVVEDSIHVMETASSDPDFFSDRAERPCGRFAVMARLQQRSSQ